MMLFISPTPVFPIFAAAPSSGVLLIDMHSRWARDPFAVSARSGFILIGLMFVTTKASALDGGAGGKEERRRNPG